MACCPDCLSREQGEPALALILATLFMLLPNISVNNESKTLYSFSQYRLGTYYVPGTIFSTWNSAVNKKQDLYFQGGWLDNEQVS